MEELRNAALIPEAKASTQQKLHEGSMPGAPINIWSVVAVRCMVGLPLVIGLESKRKVKPCSIWQHEIFEHARSRVSHDTLRSVHACHLFINLDQQ